MAHWGICHQHSNSALGFLCSPFLNWGLGSGWLQCGQREMRRIEVIMDFWESLEKSEETHGCLRFHGWRDLAKMPAFLDITGCWELCISSWEVPLFCLEKKKKKQEWSKQLKELSIRVNSVIKREIWQHKERNSERPKQCEERTVS